MKRILCLILIFWTGNFAFASPLDISFEQIPYVAQDMLMVHFDLTLQFDPHPTNESDLENLRLELRKYLAKHNRHQKYYIFGSVDHIADPGIQKNIEESLAIEFNEYLSEKYNYRVKGVSLSKIALPDLIVAAWDRRLEDMQEVQDAKNALSG